MTASLFFSRAQPVQSKPQKVGYMGAVLAVRGRALDWADLPSLAQLWDPLSGYEQRADSRMGRLWGTGA